MTKTKDGKPDNKKPDPRYYVARTISLIGSLLYAMNSNVQDYTKESAYLVGKLLAMADELHRCYCIVVRKGDLPNSLIGNSLLGRAAECPASAFEELLERMRIYLGWAKTATIEHDSNEQQIIAVRSARKLLRLAQPIAEQLHQEAALNCTLATNEKAHLFLGYLSPILGVHDETAEHGDLVGDTSTPTS